MKHFYKNFVYFFKYITRQKNVYMFLLFLIILYSLLQSFIPYFYKLFIDNFSAPNQQKLIKYLLLFIAIRFIALIAEVISYYLGDKLLFSAVMESKLEVFKHLQELDFAFHSNKSSGKIISYIKRGEGVIWGLFHSIHHRILPVFIGFVVMSIVFLSINVYATILVILSFILSILVSVKLVKLNVAARARHNREEDKVTNIVVDNLANFETVKLFSKEEHEIQRLKKSYVPWLSTAWKYVNTFRLIDLSIGSIVNISTLVILSIGLYMHQKGVSNASEFVLLLGFVNTNYPRLFELFFSFRDIGKNYTDVQKYFGLLDNDIEIQDPQNPIFPTGIQGEILFRGVSFSYKEGKKDALKNIDLHIRRGQSIALVGRSGSGKTTLVKLLMRFYDPEKGGILIDGIDIRKMTKSHLRSFIGVVPQEPILFNNSIGYNVGYAKDKVTEKEIVAAAKMANIHEFITHLKKGYETNVGERGIKLSGGQKQRVAIARMILSDPDIIIFDEATSQLDSENEKLIQDAFWRVAKNKTTIIIAHRLSTALRADKIIVMDDGKIVEQGSHNELIAKESGIYGYLWELQSLDHDDLGQLD